ncbi:hypothetical protein [Spirosoma sp.]|uniref:hypothetical protein n=1 Tax=Spirosoma sp. TaxID=1899569 RepID=UPI00261556E2|nr:hypothetical protein [Spirosoma sp.]MCX6214212.1 hypothetical protein [Spirosoma sp.]
MTLRKPYLISWLAVPVLMLMGFLFRQHTVDIHLYDTYFVIANNHVALAGAALLLVAGLGYWLLQKIGKMPNVTLTVFHLLPTIGVLMLLALPVASDSDLMGAEWFFLIVFALLVGQCAYIANILITLLRK